MAELPGVHGRVDAGFEPVAALFGRLFSKARRGGGSLVVRHRDRVVVDIWGGCADPRTNQPWERDTLGLSFSTTKGVSATVIHRLAEQGLLDYDEPVAEFWPEFAVGGKQRITVRQLLTHQAGLDSLAPAAPNARAFLDHIGAEERIAAARPSYEPGTPAYHAITFGWLVSGLARSVTGLGMNDLVHREISKTLDIDGLHIGRPRDEPHRVPAIVGTIGRLPMLAPLGVVALPAALPGRRALKAFYVPGIRRVFVGHRPPILDTELASANGMFSASSLAALYGALANEGEVDGKRLLRAETVETIGRVQTRARDRNLIIPMRWRLGYHHAFVPGVLMPRAFGHYGYAGSGGWADPRSGISVGFVSNRVYPVSRALGDLALVRLSRVAVAAVRRAGGEVRAVRPMPEQFPEDRPGMAG